MVIKSINRDKLFKIAYKKGDSFISSSLVTYVLKAKSKGVILIGITSSKKVGGAIQRNRAKRVIRAAFRELSKDIKPGYVIVFVCRTKTAHIKMDQVKKEMQNHLKKAGILSC